jgi:hypothetical protein
MARIRIQLRMSSVLLFFGVFIRLDILRFFFFVEWSSKQRSSGESTTVLWIFRWRRDLIPSEFYFFVSSLSTTRQTHCTHPIGVWFLPPVITNCILHARYFKISMNTGTIKLYSMHGTAWGNKHDSCKTFSLVTLSFA